MSATGPSHRAKFILGFASIYLIWGSTYLATRIAVQDLPPFLFGAVRFIVGGLLLWAIALRFGNPPARIARGEWKHLIIVGLCSVTLANGGNVWGLQWVASNQAALLNVTCSFWIPILGMFGARAHALTARVGLGLAVGFLGTALIFGPGLQETALATHAKAGAAPGGGLLPSAAILFGCLTWAVGTIYIRNVDTRLDVLSFTGLQMLCGGLLMLIPAALAGEFGRWHWSGPGMAALAYMTIFSSCIAYSAYAWLSVNATPAQVGSYAFVNPAIATVLGWWLLDERLGAAQLAGMAVILVGLLLVNWPARAR